MENKHTLIVGGTRGMGRVLVKTLADSGHIVSVIGRREPGEYDKTIPNVDYFILDLLDIENMSESLNNIIVKKGKLNNVVFFQQYRGKDDDWTGEIETSLTATKNVIENLVDQFKSNQEENSIVIVSSVAGKFIAVEQPLSYHIAKAAINQMIRFYAVNFGNKGIRVNGVACGTMLKEESKNFYLENEELHNLYKSIIPLGRMGTAQDLANVIIFLCSRQASFITGQTIVVDGGISLQWHESLARNLTPLSNLNVSRKTQRSPK